MCVDERCAFTLLSEHMHRFHFVFTRRENPSDAHRWKDSSHREQHVRVKKHSDFRKTMPSSRAPYAEDEGQVIVPSTFGRLIDSEKNIKSTIKSDFTLSTMH